MLLSYEEIKSYYYKGLLSFVLKKLKITRDDIMEVIFNHTSYIQDKLDEAEEELADIDGYNGEVEALNSEIELLQDQLDTYKEENYRYKEYNTELEESNDQLVREIVELQLTGVSEM